MANNSSQSSYDWFSLSVILILLAILAGFVAYTVMNQNKLKSLQNELQQTKDQIGNVNEQATEAKEAVVDEAQDQMNNVAESIAAIDNPAVRLQMIKQLQLKLNKVLTPAGADELDKVIIYVEKQPTILVNPPTQFPPEITQAMTAVKNELSKLKAQAVATTIQSNVPAQESIVGQTFTLTGTLTFISDDPVLGGSYFQLSDTNYGEPFYLYLSASNATKVKSTMEGQVVTVQVKITSVADGQVTYDVVSGPVLGSVTIAPTKASPTITKIPTKAISPTKTATSAGQPTQ